MADNHRILYARVAHGAPVPEDFAADVTAIPEAGDGQILVRNIYLALEPYYRNVMKGLPLYGIPLKPGDVMYGDTIAQVIASRNAQWQAGDYVLGRGGWQQYCVLDGAAARKLESGSAPMSTALGVLGTPGLTGFVGMVYLAPPRPGQTVAVSAATGPVGSTAGQTARMMGARVVGIAGSAQKCKYAVDVLGFDECVNYRDGELKSALKRACPDGIDVYFDNVGGATLEAALSALRVHGRIIACGRISNYNDKTPQPGPRNLSNITTKRLTIKGLIVSDWLAQKDEFEKEVGGYLQAGSLKNKETVVDGIDQAVGAFIGLFEGKNVGKMVVKLA